MSPSLRVPLLYCPLYSLYDPGIQDTLLPEESHPAVSTYPLSLGQLPSAFSPRTRSAISLLAAWSRRYSRMYGIEKST